MQAQRGVITGDSLFESGKSGLRFAKIVMAQRIIRVERQAFLKRGFGVLDLSCLKIGGAQILVANRIIRLDFHSFQK